MANSRRGVDAKLLHFCPNCHSKNIIKNGHHYGGKLQFLCKTCHKHFTEEVAKGYPPTRIPFPIISYLLYFRRKVSEFSNMRKYRRFVNHWLQYMKVSDQDVSRQTIHHWIQNFDTFVVAVASAHRFCSIIPIRVMTSYKRSPPFLCHLASRQCHPGPRLRPHAPNIDQSPYLFHSWSTH